MSLIEKLDCPGWRDYLASTFAKALDLLEQEKYGGGGSSVDDLRGWLCGGGLPYARMRLDEDAERSGFTDEHRAEIVATFDDLARRNVSRVQRLTALGRLSGGGRPPH